jgi:hypothetical protein
MIIRHGEKSFVPDGPAQTTPFGLLGNGEHSKYGLTGRRWQRAGALAILFGPEEAKFRPQKLATPNVIFRERNWSTQLQQEDAINDQLDSAEAWFRRDRGQVANAVGP